MKKILLLLTMFLLLVGLVSAGSLNVDLASRVEPGDFTVSFQMSGIDTGKEVAVSTVIPAGVTYKSYTVSGNQGAEQHVVKANNEHQWSFVASSGSPSITLTVNTLTEGSYEFDTVYMLPPANMNQVKNSVTVKAIVCGDNSCEGDENCGTCASDCGCSSNQRCESNQCQTFCGNGACDGGENYNSCPDDCEKPAATTTTTLAPVAPPEEKGSGSTVMVVVLLAILAIIIGAYFYMKKKD